MHISITYFEKRIELFVYGTHLVKILLKKNAFIAIVYEKK